MKIMAMMMKKIAAATSITSAETTTVTVLDPCGAVDRPGMRA
jgi:hypothetical protein